MEYKISDHTDFPFVTPKSEPSRTHCCCTVVCMAGGGAAVRASEAACCFLSFFSSQDQHFFVGGYIFLFVSGSSILHLPHIFVTHTTLSRSRRRPGSLVWGKQLTAKTACPSTLHRFNSLLSSSLTSSSHPTRCRRRPRWHCATFKQRQALIALLHNSLTQNQQKPFSFPTHSNATFRDCTCHVCLRARIAGAPSSGAHAARKSTCSP